MRRNTFRRESTSAMLELLWATMPDERPALRSYVDRAKAYRNDCGCAFAGVSVALTLLLAVLVACLHRQFGSGHWLAAGLAGVACLFGAALLGKIIGVGLARWRLMLLGRQLRRRYRLQAG